MKRIAIGYTRVSTAGQAEEGLSLATQEARIAVCAEQHGWQMASIFADEGSSGRTTKRRPSLRKSLDKVCATKGVLVVYSLSRLARSVVDAYRIVSELEAAEADLASVSEPIDTTTAMGRAFFGLLAVFAQLESEQTGERLKAVNAHIVAELGYRTQGCQPLGSAIVNRRRVNREEEQLILQTIIKMRDQEGLTYQAIAEALNNKNVPTLTRLRGYTGRGFADGDRRQWHAGTIHRIVLRERPDLSSSSGYGLKHDWTAAEKKQIGTMPDEELAKKLGISRVTVFRMRHKLRRGPFR